MITTKKIILIASMAALFTSCSNDAFIEVEPRDRVADDVVWASEANADLYVNDIYNQLPDVNNETQHLDQYTDNSDVGVQWMYGYVNIRQANIRPDSWPPGPWDMWKWETNFQRIRRCNLFISKVSGSALPEDYKTKRIAEVRFLRAMFYHWLWMAYGGVPIIEDVLNNTTQGDAIYHPRKTDDETFQFIVSELADIANVLPEIQTEAGRPTKGAALTLEGWCELYKASALRNPSNNIERWKKAAETNKKVIDLGVYDLLSDYSNWWMPAHNNSEESIFARQYNPPKGGSREGRMGVTFVKGVQQSWGNGQPTQELVDAYAMSNGKAISDPASGYDPQNPYKNREARFYKSIIYDGTVWQNDTIYMRLGIGSKNEIDLGYNSDVTHTGYYFRKTLDESITNGSDNRNNNTSKQNYIYFRYAEVLLSFAEAENEVNGPTSEVIAAVNKVRQRGGIPTIQEAYGSVTKEQMRNIIHRERRVELAFEDRRWWDILRLKIAVSLPDGSAGVMNSPLMGMVIEEKNGVLNYTPTVVSNRTFLDKMYLMPVPQDALDTNPVMKAQNGGPDNWNNGQNPGY